MKRIEHKTENDVELKWCGRCKRWLPLDRFSYNRSKWDGLQERCNECRHTHWSTTGIETRRNLPIERKREWRRKAVIRSYGLTPEEFEAMRLKQSNKCAICGSTDWGRPSPSIDHDHETGKVRGLLCNRCNRTLGLAEDSIPLLTKMIKYLEKNGKERQTHP